MSLGKLRLGKRGVRRLGWVLKSGSKRSAMGENLCLFGGVRLLGIVVGSNRVSVLNHKIMHSISLTACRGIFLGGR